MDAAIWLTYDRYETEREYLQKYMKSDIDLIIIIANIAAFAVEPCHAIYSIKSYDIYWRFLTIKTKCSGVKMLKMSLHMTYKQATAFLLALYEFDNKSYTLYVIGLLHVMQKI